MQVKKSSLICSILLVIFSSITILTVEASHEIMFLCNNNFEQYCSLMGNFFWSRDTADGHRQELNCNTQYPEQCKVPYYFDSNIVNLGMTLTDVNNEAANTENTLNSMFPNIGVERSPQTQNHDNRVDSGFLPFPSTAIYNGDRHCLNFFCTSKDNHIDKFFVRVNTDSDFNFETMESCPNPIPDAWDLEKTLNHELYHMLGFGHVPNANSIVAELNNNGYFCGAAGTFPLTHEIKAVLQKYGDNSGTVLAGDWDGGTDEFARVYLSAVNNQAGTKALTIERYNSSGIPVTPPVTTTLWVTQDSGDILVGDWNDDGTDEFARVYLTAGNSQQATKQLTIERYTSGGSSLTPTTPLWVTQDSGDILAGDWNGGGDEFARVVLQQHAGSTKALAIERNDLNGNPINSPNNPTILWVTQNSGDILAGDWNGGNDEFARVVHVVNNSIPPISKQLEATRYDLNANMIGLPVPLWVII